MQEWIFFRSIPISDSDSCFDLFQNIRFLSLYATGPSLTRITSIGQVKGYRRKNRNYVGIMKPVIIEADGWCDQSAITISFSVLADTKKIPPTILYSLIPVFRIRDSFSRARYRGSVNLTYGFRSESNFCGHAKFWKQRYLKHFHIWTYAGLLLKCSIVKQKRLNLN